MKYSIEQVITLIGARRVGNTDASIGWILTDSRSLCFPEETLFFALRSERNDGHRYIRDLYRRGVRNFVVERVPDEAGTEYADANFLKVVSPLAALQRLAERHRDEFDIPVVGITGSNGKTMVKEWLYQLLSPQMAVTRSPRSYNSQIGVPLSVWLLNEHSEVALLEAGISQPGEMEALRDIIQPTIGVFTSLGAAHQENFRTMEEKCREKLQLFHDARVLVYDADDAIVSRCIRSSGFKGEKIGWRSVDPDFEEQTSNRAHDVMGVWVELLDDDYSRDRKDTVLPVCIHYIYKGVEGSYRLPFIDDASVACSIACACVALYLGVTPEDLDERMSRLEPVAMRLEVKEGRHGCTLINDSYNSDLSSLDIALDFMNRRPDHKGRRRTLILSDIYQSGESEDALYREVSELVVKRGVEKFIGIGEAISRQADNIRVGEKHFFADVKEFIGSDVFRSLRDEVILIKGSRAFGFDHITELLEQKVHETILEVNLNAVVANLNHYRSFMRPETKLVCMVKADAYGAGAVEVAKTLQDHRVDYLAVAVADEGVTLRKNGITGNIMIMNPEMTAFKTMFDYDLEPEVYSFRLMDALIRAAEKEGITGWPVHIKLDTGMHRLGFDPVKDIDEVIDRLKHQNAIIPRSVFSHFVGSDSDDFDSFSARQFALFDEASRRLQAAFDHRILRHIDNSAGIEHFPERQLDMCRLGIGLYGVDSIGNRLLDTVSTLKTTILQLRHVPADETVGYSRRGVLKRDSVIAAIPIGYADGLNRRLGNGRCYCLVNGHKAPYVGNICMDVAMIDVTDIDCREGDSVEIFGPNLPVTVLSDVLETIPYEVLTSVSGRVKKVYYQD
ncbi:MAG: bifunctional UDP-N-acetylmuramoyl-tripeptide:D-alanyl-D-alanine ligase/alanine racemase [Prevotella sp.]|nr:bifunctional UDP-N-acetylmuramoyl-tripeptide:D-alanyl-D-alanine ligase/alanine racemase [Prevotella sp.]